MEGKTFRTANLFVERHLPGGGLILDDFESFPLAVPETGLKYFLRFWSVRITGFESGVWMLSGLFRSGFASFGLGDPLACTQ